MFRNRIPRRFFGFAVSLVLWGLGVTCCPDLATAAVVPISGTGYNADMVVGVGQNYNTSSAAGGLTATMDNGTALSGGTLFGSAWYTIGQNTAFPLSGIPMGQTINVTDATTGGDQFTLQSTGSNNVLFMNGPGFGPATSTFNLNAPANYNTLSVLASAGNGGGVVNATLFFSGGTSAASFTVSDWFNGGNLAYTSTGRITGWNFSAGTNNYDNTAAANPRLYFYDLTNVPSTLGNLQSITFSHTAANNSSYAIFGVSGNTVATAAIWTGSSSNVWSVAGSDTNWNTPSQAYSDGVIVGFNNTGIHTGINIAGVVQPSVVQFNNSLVPYSFSGAAISGTGSVALNSGAGSVTFNNANTYTGATTVSGGSLVLATSGAISNSTVTVSGGALNLSAAGALQTTPLTVTGGSVVLNNANPAPNTTISVGSANGLAFALGNTSTSIGGLTGAGGIALTDAGGNPVSLTIGGNNASPAAYSGVLSGSGALVKTGGGTATLSGANTFIGGVSFNGGVVSVATISTGGTNNAALGRGPANASGQTLTFNGGTFQYTGANTQANPVVSTAAFNPKVTFLSGGGTWNTTGGFVGFSGSLSGSGNFTLVDTAVAAGAVGQQVFFNTATLNPSPAFTGNLILQNGGNIQYRTDVPNAFGTTATVFLNFGGVFSNDTGATLSGGTGGGGFQVHGFNQLSNPFVLNGGSLSTQGVNVNYAGSVTITGGTNSFVGDFTGSAGSLVIGGALLGSGSVTTIGTTTVTLTGDTSGFTGTWSSSSAATALAGNATGGTGSAWIANAGYFINNSGIVNMGALSGGPGTISNNIAASSSTLSVGALNTNTVFSGALGLGSGSLSLVKVGAGSLTLTGNNAAVGTTLINSGTLALGSPTALGGSTFNTGGAGTLVLGTTATTFGGLTGSSNLSLTTSAGQAIAFTVGGNASTTTYSGNLSDGGLGSSLNKVGSGGLTLLGSNAYTGNTTISFGYLAFGATSLPNVNPHSITLAGGFLAASGPYTNVSDWLNSGLIAPNPTSGGIALVNSSNETISLATVGSGTDAGTYGNISLGSIGNNTYSGVLTPASTNYFLGGGGPGGVLTYTPSLTTGYGLVVQGPGKVILTDTGSLTGPVTVGPGGVLQVSSSATLLNSSPLTINGGLAFPAGFGTVTLPQLSGTGGGFPLADTSGGPISLIFGANNLNSTYAGILTGIGSITKIGTGVTNLNGASTFSGGVTINGGAIATNVLTSGTASGLGATNGSTVTMNGATLIYNGGSTLNNPTVNTQAFSPTLTLGAGGGTLNVICTAATGQFLTFAGSLSGSGNLTIVDTADTTGVPGNQLFFGTTTVNASPSFTGNLIVGAGGNIQYRTTAPNAFGTTATVTVLGGGYFGNDNGFTGNAGTLGNNPASQNTFQNPFVLNGGSLSTNAVNVNYAGPVTITGGTTSYIGDAVGSAGSLTVGGALLGSGTVSTIGTATVTLTGATSGFTGTWVSTSAATAFTGSNANGSTSAAFVANGAGFLINNGSTVNMGALSGPTGNISNGVTATSSTLSVGALGTSTTYSGVLANGSGTLNLVKIGAGSLTLPTANTFTGTTLISGGTLQLGNGITSSGGMAGPIINNATLAIANPTLLPLTAAISGSGGLVKSGTGTLMMVRPATYTGPTSILAGVLAFAPSSITGFGGNGTGWQLNGGPTVSGDTLTITQAIGSQTRTAYYATQQMVPVNGFTAKFTYTPQAGTGTADGIDFILQSQSLTAVGGGGGLFGYSGITPSVAINMNLFNNVNQTAFWTGGIVGPEQTITGGISLHNGDPINITVNYNSGTQVMAWSMTDALNSGLTYATSATGVNLQSILNGTTAWVGFTGATGGNSALQNISGFSFSQANGLTNALPSASLLTIAGGATVDLSGYSQVVGSLSGAGTVTNSFAGNTSTLTAGGDNSSQIFTGVLTNGAGTLAMRKSGSGSLTLASNNPYSGGTTVNGGTLQIGNGGNTGTIGSGSIANSGALAFNRSDAGLTIASSISGPGSLYQIGSGTTTLAANNSYAGGTSINNGTLVVGSGGNSGSLGTGPVVNNNALIFSRSDAGFTVANSISGTGSVAQNGTGTVVLTGTNGYTGPTSVNSGGLYFNAPNSTTSVNVSGGATLGGKGSANLAAATVQDGGNVEAGYQSHGSLTLSGLNFVNTGNIFVNTISNYTSTAAINVTGSNSLTDNSNGSGITFVLGGAAPLNTVTQTSHLLQYSGMIQGAGAFSSPNLDTSGIVGLSSRATFNLVTSNPGFIDVQYSVDYPIWTGAGNAVWVTSPPAQSPKNWKLASNSSATDFLANDIAGFDDSSGANTTVNITSADVAPAAVLFDNNTASFLIQGTKGITGQALLIMNSGGAVTITNSNSYFGGTTVNAGRLNIGNAQALGSVPFGATLTMNGGSLDNSTGSPLTIADYPLNWNAPFTFVGTNPLNLGVGAVTLGSSASVNVSGSTLTLGGVIADSGNGFSKSGAGVLLLLGSSTYTSATSVTGGTLQVGNGGSGASIATTSGISVGGGAALIFNDTDAITMNSSISGAGSVNQKAGLLTFTNSNSFTGGATVNGGTLQLSNGGPTGSLAPNSTVTVNVGATLQLNANGALGSSGSSTIVTANDGVVMANSGFRIPLWNTTNLTGGTLTSAAGVGDGAGNYSLSGQINATSDGSGNPSAISATQVSLLNNTVLNVTRGSSPTADLIVGSVVASFSSGTGLTIQGNGITQFTGANTYNGGTTVTGGTLQLASATATLGANTSPLSVSSGGTVDLNGFSASVGALNGNGVVDNLNGSTGTLTIGNGAANGTYSGTIQNTGGAVTLVKAGASTQVLSGTNTYTGGTQINAGALNFVPSSLPFTTVPPNITFGGGYASTSAGTTTGVGGRLQWATGNTLDVSAGVAPIASGVSAGFDTNGNSVAFATALSGTGGITKAGAGTLTMSAQNTYQGVTNITGGTLIVADPTTLQNSTVNVQVNNGLAFSVPAATLGGLSGNANVNLGATALSVGANGTHSIYQGVLSSGTGLIKTGSGTQTLTAANNYSGATDINGGVLHLNPFSNTPVSGFGIDTTGITGQNATWSFNTNGVTQTSVTNGVLTLTNNVGGSGRSAFYDIKVPVGAFTASYVYTGAAAGADGSAFMLQNDPNGLSALGQLGGSLGYTGNGLSNPGITPSVGIGMNIYAGAQGGRGLYWLSGGTLVTSEAIAPVSVASGDPIRINLSYDGSNILSVSYTDLTTSATYSTSRAMGNFATLLGGTSAYVGFSGASGGATAVQTISNFSYSFATSSAAFANILPTTTPVTIRNGASLDMTDGTQTVASLSSTDGLGSSVLLGNGILTIGGNTSTTFDGSISGGSGSLVKNGNGSLVLTGVGGIPTASSTFGGGVTVNSGTLTVAAVANGNKTVLGAGNNGRTVTVNAGGTLLFVAPNASATGFNSTNVPTLNINGGTVTNADPAGSNAINNALNNVNLNNGLLTATTGQHGGYAAWNINGVVTSAGNSVISTSDPVYGTVMLANAGASNGSTTFNVSSGTLTVTAPLVQDNADSNVSGLIKIGAGTMVLSSTDNYTGGTIVSDGTLVVTTPGALVDGSSLTVGSVFPAPVVPSPVVSAGAAVPEPGTLLLMAVGFGGAVAYRRWRKSFARRTA